MEKQRKFLLVLPLLVIPFLTLAFWALGGGTTPQQQAATNRLDTKLPEARFNEKDRRDKMAIYQAIQQDSTLSGISPAFLRSVGLDNSAAPDSTATMTADEQASQVQTKLEQLNQQLNEPTLARQTPNAYTEQQPQRLKQLKKIMHHMAAGSNAPDPEMQQLNAMLDKIKAIQNPGAVQSLPTKSESARPFRAIPAVVDGKQKVADGATVKLKLTESATIHKQRLPKGQEIYGSCQITNQRLLLTIQHIRLDKQIIPVNLVVFSLDGMPGIPAPEAELPGAAGEGVDRAMQSMQILSLDQSLGAQAAAGGLNVVKSLFGKKIRKIKVKLKDEFPVLLKINR